jgi:hypothetical protein
LALVLIGLLGVKGDFKMILVQQEPKVGNLYKFVYKNKSRIALVRHDNGEVIECYDFAHHGFRNFKHENMGPATDITDKLKVYDNFDVKDVERLEDAGCNVFEDFDNDRLYAVRIRQRQNV